MGMNGSPLSDHITGRGGARHQCTQEAPGIGNSNILWQPLPDCCIQARGQHVCLICKMWG